MLPAGSGSWPLTTPESPYAESDSHSCTETGTNSSPSHRPDVTSTMWLLGGAGGGGDGEGGGGGGGRRRTASAAAGSVAAVMVTAAAVMVTTATATAAASQLCTRGSS